MEKAAVAEGIILENPTIKLNEGGQIEYDFDEKYLQTLAKKVAHEVQKPVDVQNKTGFFDTQKGRFTEYSEVTLRIFSYLKDLILCAIILLRNKRRFSRG